MSLNVEKIAQLAKCITIYGRMVAKKKKSKAWFYMVDFSFGNRFDSDLSALKK